MSHATTHGSLAEQLCKVKEKSMSETELYEIDMKLWKVMSGMEQRTIHQILTHFYRTEGGRTGIDASVVKSRITALKDQGVFEVKPCKGFTEYKLVKGKVPQKPAVEQQMPNVKHSSDWLENHQPTTNASSVFPMREHFSATACNDLPVGLDENFEFKEDALVKPVTDVSLEMISNIDWDPVKPTAIEKPTASDSPEQHYWKVLSDYQPHKKSEIIQSLMEVRGVSEATAVVSLYKFVRETSWVTADKSSTDWLISMTKGTPMPERKSRGGYRKTTETQTTKPVVGSDSMPETANDQTRETAALVDIRLRIKGMNFTIPEMVALHESLINANLSNDSGNGAGGILQTAHTIKGVVFTTQELWEILEELDKFF